MDTDYIPEKRNLTDLTIILLIVCAIIAFLVVLPSVRADVLSAIQDTSNSTVFFKPGEKVSGKTPFPNPYDDNVDIPSLEWTVEVSGKKQCSGLRVTLQYLDFKEVDEINDCSEIGIGNLISLIANKLIQRLSDKAARIDLNIIEVEAELLKEQVPEIATQLK